MQIISVSFIFPFLYFFICCLICYHACKVVGGLFTYQHLCKYYIKENSIVCIALNNKIVICYEDMNHRVGLFGFLVP